MNTEKEIKRLYWSTGEVAQQLGVQTSAIRFWCKFFNIYPAKGRSTTRGFVRRFNAKEVGKLFEIRRLLKVEGYTIPGAKRQLALKNELKENLFSDLDSLC